MSTLSRTTKPRTASVKKGGRKTASCSQPEVVEQLKENIEEQTAGSAVEPGKLWTNRSPDELARELVSQGFDICGNTVARLLREVLHLGRRQPSKSLALGEHADRDAQFRKIARLKREYFDNRWPVISIDTKKKETLGPFQRPGKAWTDGQVKAFDHDFPSAGGGKVIPYGVYDLGANEGFIYLAFGSDTGQLACAAIRRWWYRMGRHRYWRAPKILALADCGGSNGYRVPLFRESLCDLARHLHRDIRVAHLPPYCSKYNPIDHRLFCHLNRTIRGLLLQSLETIQEAFSRATTTTGLRVVVEVSRQMYQSGIKARRAFLEQEPIRRDTYLPAFNYVAPSFF